MTREQTVERLNAWATRAQHEAFQADTRDDAQSWQGQAQVLASVARYVASQDPQTADTIIYRNVVADRSRSLSEWMSREGGIESAIYAGAVAGYDVALTALRDMAGRAWPKTEQHVG